MQKIGRLAELVEDWEFLIHRDGAKRALPGIAADLAWLPYRHLNFFVFERSLTLPLPDLVPAIALEIRPFEQTDLERVRDIDRPSEARLCARRLASGHTGLIALHQGQPVGHAWGCAQGDPNLERVQLKLEAGDVLCADVYVVPAYRGQGIQTSLTLARLRLFRDQGYQRAITYIEVRNGPSVAVWQRKLGSLKVGQIDFLRFGAWYRVRYQGND
jgi:GNAT superfamily N-acetyltransferase